jgi:hypothetical protein
LPCADGEEKALYTVAVVGAMVNNAIFQVFLLECNIIDLIFITLRESPVRTLASLLGPESASSKTEVSCGELPGTQTGEILPCQASKKDRQIILFRKTVIMFCIGS